MKKPNRVVTTLLTMALLVGPSIYALAQGESAGAWAGPQDRDRDYDHDRGWEAPPSEYSSYGRQGFHEGIEGARKDIANHRSPDVNRRDEYRHPHVPHDAREDYREGYQRGYQMAYEHAVDEQHPR